jgi:hypothetical protein
MWLLIFISWKKSTSGSNPECIWQKITNPGIFVKVSLEKFGKVLPWHTGHGLLPEGRSGVE